MKLLKHLHTINKHRRLVRKYCFKCHLFKQGLIHDLSKYSWTEFWVGVRYYSGIHSPNANERHDKGYSEAWMHHKGRNKHHCEYWVDYSKTEDKYVPIKMPKKYIVESFCDRIAAAKIYNQDNYKPDIPLNYLINERSHLPIHEETYQELLSLLKYYLIHGEGETFKYIRKDYLKK